MSVYDCNDCRDTGLVVDGQKGGGELGCYCWCVSGRNLRQKDREALAAHEASEAEARAYVDEAQSQQLLIKGKYEQEYFNSIADMRDRYLGDD